MQIVYKNKEVLIKKINAKMRISAAHLCIFFATQDSRNKPDYKPNFDNHYDLQGFYVNLSQSVLPSPEPDEVINCILGNSYEHFIWISKRICEGEDIHFAWVYSHELQHLKQNLKNPFLLIVAQLLDCIEYKDRYTGIPTEFECELEAKKTVIDIWDKDKCDSYLRKMMVDSCDNEKRYRNLLELNVMAKFDVEEEIKQVICTDKDKFKQFQKQMQDNGCTDYSIDIDKLCSCKDPHTAIISAVKKMAQNGVMH